MTCAASTSMLAGHERVAVDVVAARHLGAADCRGARPARRHRRDSRSRRRPCRARGCCSTSDERVQRRARATYRTARSVLGSKSTTRAVWRPPFGVSISTLLEPATTCALVTKYPGASGQDDPASAPPSQPAAMTFEVTLVASRMPGGVHERRDRHRRRRDVEDGGEGVREIARAGTGCRWWRGSRAAAA